MRMALMITKKTGRAVCAPLRNSGIVRKMHIGL